MRKVSLLLAGVAVGAVSSVLVSQVVFSRPAAHCSKLWLADLPLLNLFGDVFEKVRSD